MSSVSWTSLSSTLDDRDATATGAAEVAEASRRRPFCEVLDVVRTMDPLRAAAAAAEAAGTEVVVDVDRDVAAEGIADVEVAPTTRLEARKGRSASAVVAVVVVVLEAVVGRVRTTRRAAPTPLVVVVVVAATAAEVPTVDRVEVDVEVVARGLIASLRAALPLSSAPVMVVRVRLALVRSPSAALFRVPRTPEAAEAADALVGAVTLEEVGLDGPASAAPPSRP